MADDHYTELLLELECPICTNYMTPPIRQCATGHSICSDCRSKLPKCVLCQGDYTESRNIALEGLAVKMRYPCMNKDSGCNLKLAYNEREFHEAKCAFKGYKCAMEKCPWVGKLEDIPQHWASKKMSGKPYRASNVCQAKLKSESYYLNIIEALGNVFWYKFKLSNGKLYWAVQYIGKAADAENYCYEIEIFKSGYPKHKIVLGDYCKPVDIGNSALFDGLCISLPLDAIEPFRENDQPLMYYMRVYNVGGTVVKQESRSQAAPERKDKEKPKGPQNKNKDNNPQKQVQGKNSKKRAEGSVTTSKQI